MKAILSKEAGGYDLYRIDEDGKRVTFASTQDYKQKLSLKNCQAIERGYDLDELAKREYLDGYDTTELCRAAFKDGFQKALEILGDKKFSEDDVRLMLVDMANFIATKELKDDWDLDVDNFFRKRDFFIDKQIQSLQQTEWDVTYNSEELDADGYLILKRV